MPDWAGHDGMTTARRYRAMAERQLPGISPTYERLCHGVAGDPQLLARLDTLPAPKRQPNLLLGAVRFLGGPVSTYSDFRSFVLTEWDAVAATMGERRTQTNEPGRCATLLPVLAALPQPLALLEVGASAGLCLYPDRYAYRYSGAGDGALLGSSPVVLDCVLSGPVRVPATVPQVVWRAGLDLNPLDVRAEDDRRWLESLVWPEQRSRFATLHAALDVVAADPPRIVAGDLTRDTAALAAQAPRSATLVVFHSAVLAYLDDAGRAAFAAQLHEIAATRPVVWLSNEAPGVVVDVAAPPGPAPFVLARDGAPLAFTGPHGQFLDWMSS